MNNKQNTSIHATENVQSATECTGLMPAMPQEDIDAEHLSELYAIHFPTLSTQAAANTKPGERAVAHPSDEHNRQMRKEAYRLSSGSAPSHPAQGHSQHGSSRPGEQAH